MTQGVTLRPTDEQRRTVKAMAGFGIPHEGIAVMLEIDAKTLRKHFHAELERGSVEATAKVAQSLFHMATVDKNVAAAIFWMKARAGWREKHEVNVTNDLRGLSDAELQRLADQGYREWYENRREGDPETPLIEGRADVGDED